MAINSPALIMPTILQLAGVVVLLAEIFIPSGGMLGVIAAGLFVYSLFIVFNDISITTGFFFLFIDFIALTSIIYWGIKLIGRSPAALIKTLSSQEGVTSQDSSMESLLGKTGVTLADLRPSGLALIEGHRLDVISQGEYIKKESQIIVHKVTGNQIIVSLLNHQGETHDHR